MKIHPVIIILILTQFLIYPFSRAVDFDDGSEELTASSKMQTFKASKLRVKHKTVDDPRELSIFRRAYPFVTFTCDYDEVLNDWKIDIRVDLPGAPVRHGTLYWCECRFLPREKITQKSLYRVMLYKYPKQTPDPKYFTESDADRIVKATSDESRSSGPIDPPFLYDIIYDTGTQGAIESHIKKLPIFNRSVRAHELLRSKLEVITEKVNHLAQTDEEVANFLATLAKTDGYNYRNVRDTSNRSFHSMGLAIDILPRGYNNKTIYWLWRREMVGLKWFLTPLENRWMPPAAVIKIFESMGFVWGGKWMVWDDMHFEYHPEVLIYNGF